MSLRDELLPGEGTNHHLDASTTVVRNNRRCGSQDAESKHFDSQSCYCRPT